jgi:GT2 family glycosyltransferase
MAGVDASDNVTRYRWLVVANDAEDDVISGLQVADFDWVDHRNPDPGSYYIPRVYRAWNRGVLEARTPLVCMLNSDMYASDDWLDNLMSTKPASPNTVPTSLLVESGRLPSAMPEHVHDFGRNPEVFDRDGFLAHANTIKKPGRTEPGRLYMPILVDRQEFFDVGGYPDGNPPGTTGDKDLIRRYAKAGFKHVTARGSVVYHAQQGEQEWP